MTVKDLKEKLKGVPDNMQVVIPTHPTEGFTGTFFTPCTEESGVTEMGLYDEEEEKEALLLNKPITEESFWLVPCGFSDKHEDAEQRAYN